MAREGLRSELQFLVLSLLGMLEVLLAHRSKVEEEPMRKTLTSESRDFGFGSNCPVSILPTYFSQAFQTMAGSHLLALKLVTCES